jgi:capsular exopolysaccharide synthesis family protein
VDDNFPNDMGATPVPRGGSRNILQVFWQRRGLLAFGAFVGLLFGLLTYSQRPPVYRSSAQVLVVKKVAPNTMSGPGGDSRMQVMEDYVSTHLIVIRSPFVISKAVNNRKWNLAGLRSLQGRDPVSTIQASLTAGRDMNKDAPSGSAGNNIVNLSYSGPDPGDVQIILAAVIESYRDFLDDTYKSTSEKTVELLRDSVDKVTRELTGLRAKQKEFLKNTPDLILGEKGEPVYQKLIAEYQRKETESHELVVGLEKRLKAVDEAIRARQPRENILALGERRYEKGTLNQDQAQKANRTALETALFTLFQQEEDLISFYGEDHPDVLRVRKKIEATKEFHQRLERISRDGELAGNTADPVQAMVTTLTGELALARANLDWVRELLNEQLKKAREQESFYNEERALRADISLLAKSEETLRLKLQDINLVRDQGGFDAKAINEPGPGFKTSPIFWQFLMLGLFLGLCVSAGGAYALDLADKSFRNPDEIRRRLGLPLIGHVPFLQTNLEPVKTVDGAGNPVELDPGLVSLHDPGCQVSEGFRGIRTAIYFSTHAQRHKVIQVTSPNMGDGKTTVITNLAVSIAQSGRKVLLVDADLRRPRVHRAFGLSSKVGLAEVIAGTAELDEAIQVSVAPNLSVLPCGRRPQNPSELLTSARFEDLIDDLRDAFDYVLVDTPPLLAVSDPCIVAPRVDGLLLTVRLCKNGRPSAERAGDILAGLKVNCIGVVVNGVGKHGAMSGYGYEHYHYTDEYTTSYSNESAEDAAAETAEPEDVRSKTPAAPLVQPTLAADAVPSANGHASHAHHGE